MESTKPIAPPNIPAAFRVVHRQIRQWRKTRRHGEPMPESLWAMAANLAGKHGVVRVARHLRLDYYSLKDRHEGMARQGIPQSEKKPAFIELALPSPVAVPECIVELENPRGSRMRIQLKGAGVPDLTLLSRSFWDVES
jgi:hypothetical protein